MPKEKVTVTLDAANLQELRAIVGARSLSAAIDTALDTYVARLRHLAAVDDLLAEMEHEHGPVPPETLEWAAVLVDEWESSKQERGARRAS
jgi:hypothetical protein